ncbi:ribosome hibernation-promoting factor, HPF/YfiA family [Zavarzinella formosa]|uniref:ribosome hibernation-promoting factor, HPF/YfiA family n=1 Tax=Zavarzinella formosa TaxID=360055 RepID=UPI000318A320|nr:ribosome-associated translation inhibitor RaiA [Zavarzinella formosa]
MQIKIATRHGHLSDGHQAEINAKCEKLLHYFSRITMIEVTIDLADKIFKSVEIKVDAEHKHDFVAQDKHEELMAAVDLTFERVQHQIHKYKEKITNHHP